MSRHWAVAFLCRLSAVGSDRLRTYTSDYRPRATAPARNRADRDDGCRPDERASGRGLRSGGHVRRELRLPPPEEFREETLDALEKVNALNYWIKPQGDTACAVGASCVTGCWQGSTHRGAEAGPRGRAEAGRPAYPEHVSGERVIIEKLTEVGYKNMAGGVSVPTMWIHLVIQGAAETLCAKKLDGMKPPTRDLDMQYLCRNCSYAAAQKKITY
jgi:hypothetical protein